MKYLYGTLWFLFVVDWSRYNRVKLTNPNRLMKHRIWPSSRLSNQVKSTLQSNWLSNRVKSTRNTQLNKWDIMIVWSINKSTINLIVYLIQLWFFRLLKYRNLHRILYPTLLCNVFLISANDSLRLRKKYFCIRSKFC